MQRIAVDREAVGVRRLLLLLPHQTQWLVLVVANLLRPLFNPEPPADCVKEQSKHLKDPLSGRRGLPKLLPYRPHAEEVGAQLERPPKGVDPLDRDPGERLLRTLLGPLALLLIPLLPVVATLGFVVLVARLLAVVSQLLDDVPNIVPDPLQQLQQPVGRVLERHPDW